MSHFKISFIVVSIVIVVVIAYLFLSQSVFWHAASGGLSAVSTVSLDTSNWQFYSNSSLGFSVKYPPLLDPYNNNKPREDNLDTPGYAPYIGFIYPFDNNTGYIQLGEFAQEFDVGADCSVLYSRIEPFAQPVKIGQMSYYFVDHYIDTADESGGVSPFQVGYLSTPNSLPNGSCLVLNVLFPSNESTPVTKEEEQGNLNIAYTMLASLTLLP